MNHKFVVMRALTILHHKYQWMNDHKEISDLTLAAGFTEITSLSFKKIHDIHYLPELKVDDLRDLINQYKIDIVIFNESLSVSQLHKLDALLNHPTVRLMDKVMVILEIFANKANSKDIQLQIKLAEFRYVLPRLRQVIGESLNTEKQARDRGTGETLESIMKSDFKLKISIMEKQLRDLQKETTSQSKIMMIPILGFYSVGKTTLFNMLTDSRRETDAQAFTTMFLKSSWSKILGFTVDIVDTIGLVDLPPMIVDSFSIMLQRVFSSRYMIICVDGSIESESMKDQLQGLDEYYQKYANQDIRYCLLFVFTKCDEMTAEMYEEKKQILEKNISEGIFPCDHYQIMGARSDRLKFVQQSFIENMDKLLKDELFEFELMDLTPSQVSKVYNSARIISENYEGQAASIHAIIPLQMFYDQLGEFIRYLTPESRDVLKLMSEPIKEYEMTEFI